MYLLTEEIPDSVRLAYVTECRSDVRSFSSPLSPFTVIEPEGRVNVELLPGEDLECDWYNILQDTPGTITLIKYWCQGNVVNAENCEIFIRRYRLHAHPAGRRRGNPAADRQRRHGDDRG